MESYWVGDIDSRRSNSGCVFIMFGGAINWMSKRQVVVTFSTTKVEYMETTHACKEAIFLRRLFSDVGLDVEMTNICFDS